MDNILISQINKDEFQKIIKDIIVDALEKNNNKSNVVEESNELIKIEEVSKIFQVSEVTIHKWKKQGLLPYQKLNRRLYFKKSDILNSLRNINLKKP